MMSRYASHDLPADDYTALYPVANMCTNTVRLPILSSYEDSCRNVLAAFNTVLTFTTA